MFVYSGNGGMTVLLLYIDDIVLIVSFSSSLLCHFIQLLKDEFSMSNMGSLPSSEKFEWFISLLETVCPWIY